VDQSSLALLVSSHHLTKFQWLSANIPYSREQVFQSHWSKIDFFWLNRIQDHSLQHMNLSSKVSQNKVVRKKTIQSRIICYSWIISAMERSKFWRLFDQNFRINLSRLVFFKLLRRKIFVCCVVFELKNRRIFFRNK